MSSTLDSHPGAPITRSAASENTPSLVADLVIGAPRGRCYRPIVALLFVCLLLRGAGTAMAAPAIRAVDSVAITVSDADRSAEFFTDVLTFEKVSDIEVSSEEYEHLEGVFGLRMRVVRMRLGDEAVELVQYLAPQGRPLPVDSHSNDRWFQHVAIVVSDMDAAYRVLRSHKVAHASSGPQTLPGWNKNAAGIRAFYFKDPDGHALEVIEFPEGKGLAKWHQPGAEVFRGIDHTAIVVQDTDASLRFYRDTLGMKVVGESENFGTEQEHLNNVFGARLRITSLRAERGAGVELLEYLSPRDGRAAPADLQANDLVHWQTRLTLADVDAMAGALLDRRVIFVSPGVTHLPRKEFGFDAAVLVRDPDGHAVQLVDR
jgi:catechol 2,3-dioxygenase-like lactoylglutathione lyase family enzyme